MQDIALTSMLEARTSLAGQVLMTPVLPIGQRATAAGNPIYAKAENLQPSGSFKIRGALHAVHLVVEPSAALGLAAALTYPQVFPGDQPVVTIASGGNTTLATLCSLLGS